MSMLRAGRSAAALASRRSLYTSATAAGQTKHFALRYTFPDDMVERRAPVRDEHLALTREYADSGKLVLGGAIGPASSPTGGLIVFRCSTAEEVVEFVNRDPYRSLVKGWRVDEYAVVSGTAAPSESPSS